MSSSRPSPATPTAPTVPTTVSVTSPADVLSYVPHALGFTPVESLVVMTMTGNRLGATLRVDLPSPGPAVPADAVAFAETVLSFLRGDTAADGVLVALYTFEEPVRDGLPPRADLVKVLEEVLGHAGLPVRSGWVVSGTTWRDYSCTDAHCCPWPGYPLDTVADSRLNAEMIFGGSSFETSAAAAVLRSAPYLSQHGSSVTSGLDADEVEEAQAHFAAACAGHWDEAAQFEATSRFWDAVLSRQLDTVDQDPPTGQRPGVAGQAPDERPDGRPPAALDAESAGFLLASIESRTVRDFLLVSACLGSQEVLEGIRAEDILRNCPEHAGTASGAAPPLVVPFIMPSMVDARYGGASSTTDTTTDSATDSMPDTTPGARPAAAHPRPVAPAGLLFTEVLAGLHRGPVDWARVELMTGILLRLVSVAGSSGEARAAALTMLGWFEYARGRGSRAAVYFDAAEEALPGYRLARLLTELLNRGGLPEWARQRSTAWRPTATSRHPEAA